MPSIQLNLRSDEEIIGEADWAVLTNQRLVAGLNRKDRTEITDEAELSDIVSFKMSNGGQESRMQTGLKFLGAGAAITVLQIIFADLLPPRRLVETVLFLLGAAGVLLGFYLVIGSVMAYQAIHRCRVHRCRPPATYPSTSPVRITLMLTAWRTRSQEQSAVSDRPHPNPTVRRCQLRGSPAAAPILPGRRTSPPPPQ